MNKIAIIGMGNMGTAIYSALESKFDVVGCDKADNVNEKIDNADIVIISIKPQDFDSLAEKIKVSGSQLIISIMAGVSLKNVAQKLKCESVVRVMPNLPLKCAMAVSGWFASEKVEAEDKNVVREILTSFGVEIEVDEEDKIDKITALSGSGPAYYYFLNRCMRMKALAMGFSDEDARKIAQGTFLGAAELLKQSGECSGKLIERIKSKGGTTEAALNSLEENEVEKMLGTAIDKAYKRAKELNK